MRLILIIILSTFIASGIVAQDEKALFPNMELNGYVKYMNTSMFNDINSVWLVDNLVHNRLNYRFAVAHIARPARSVRYRGPASQNKTDGSNDNRTFYRLFVPKGCGFAFYRLDPSGGSLPHPSPDNRR